MKRPADNHNPHEKLTVLCTGIQELVPKYANSHAAGADLMANIQSSISVSPGQRILVPTGIHLAIPMGWEGQVRPRSGLAWHYGLTLLNSPGTIDSDYRGEVKVLMINMGEETVHIDPGQRIAQIVIAKVPQSVFQFTDQLSESQRGTGGFGSTGR